MTNILGGLKEAKQNRLRLSRYDPNSSDIGVDGPNDPTSFVLVSAAPTALKNFETPFGEFNGIKRQGEGIVKNDFPSLSHTVLQLGKFDDNFVEESLELLYDDEVPLPKMGDNGEEEEDMDKEGKYERSKRKINRRDAAKAAVDALLDENLEGNTVEVWTALRG